MDPSFWEHDETPEQKAILDGIVARATFGTSRCESPGCGDGEEEHAGNHPAIFAFRITNAPEGATYENFCDTCEDRDKDGPDCFMKRMMFKGVLLCACCVIVVVAGIRNSEKNIDWITRPISEDTEAVLALVPRDCKIHSIQGLKHVPEVQQSARNFFAGVPEEAVVGTGEITSVHAIPITPELQAALEANDRDEVLRIITPIISEHIAKNIAKDMQLQVNKRRLRKHGEAMKPAITADEILDLEEAQVEGKTLQDLGLQIPKQHEGN